MVHRGPAEEPLRAAYILSIKPRFGEAIVNGSKRVELRRLTTTLMRPGDLVFLYFTAPVKAVIAYIDVGDVVLGTSTSLVQALRDWARLGVEEDDWDYTWRDAPNMAIFINAVTRCAEPISITRLSELGIRVPRSYARLRSDIAASLLSECLRPTS